MSALLIYLWFLTFLCKKSRGADMFLMITSNGTSKLHFTSQDIDYNVGDVVKLECSISNLLYSDGKNGANLSWVYDGNDVEETRKPVITREITLQKDNDGKSLECEFSSNINASHKLAVSFRRNKSQMELAREKPNIFKIVLIVLGVVVAITLLVLIGYRLYLFARKKKSHDEEGFYDIPLESKNEVSYATLDLEQTNGNPTLRRDDPAYAEIGVVNVSY